MTMGNYPATLALRTDKYSPGSVVVITGATKGIGKEVALRYARRKCSLVLAARGQAALEATKLQCLEEGAAACVIVSTDVTDENACRKLIDEAIRAFGRIDVLVLNAGIIAHFPFSEFADMEVFRRLFEVNFFGYVYCTKYALPHLKKTKGQIVVISSISGEIGLPLRSAYCSSKFAVTGFFEAVRMECGDQIDVTICCPPSVNTGMRDEKAFVAAERMLEQLRGKSVSDRPVDGVAVIRRPRDLQIKSEHETETQEDSKQDGGRENRSHSSSSLFSKLDNKRAIDRRMPVEECVDYIMKAADKRAQKVMFPLYSYLAVYVRPFLPDLIDPFIKRAAKL
ncbi:hypothetical protein Esti_005001 [Eimeria stiedai]